ncbi:hypothetical protein GF339_08975 [candidate division KSB3 bacterium]|uniref:DUF1468 domain-containing protein n=1 Tax=candidate division KSB3 bacterium TaxID=2044937 RepID=A0A9D5Q5D1_9BACT|nr:hypothetical protein [candidate division KSB3 bacterium]MBD3324704.1 hypothetical protein [candidate division KSB3 bacterium]
MQERQMPKADFVTSIVLFIFSVTIIIMSIRMPLMEELGANPYSVPGIVPGFLGGILLFLSIILLVRSILKQGYQLNLHGKTIMAFVKDEASIRVLMTLFLSLIYGVGFLGNIPYVLATFLYVMAFIIIFEYRFDAPWQRRKKTIFFAGLQAVLVAGIVAAIFRYLFLVKLP